MQKADNNNNEAMNKKEKILNWKQKMENGF